MEVGQEFVNIGWGLKGSRLPYQPWAAAAQKQRNEENGKDDPTTHCLPGGVVKGHTSALMRKIVQTPGLIVILHEASAFRQIFTDGRPLPEINQPTFNGYSTGKWEGDALVVQTIGFSDGIWLDRGGSPLTEAARMTERFRRVSYGKLDIEITVDDPK